MYTKPDKNIPFQLTGSRREGLEVLLSMWVLSTARTKRPGCFAPMSWARFFCLGPLWAKSFQTIRSVGKAAERIISEIFRFVGGFHGCRLIFSLSGRDPRPGIPKSSQGTRSRVKSTRAGH
jgi:hypothetical protein